MDVIRLRCVKCGQTFELTDPRGGPIELSDAELAVVLGDFVCPDSYCWGELVREDA